MLSKLTLASIGLLSAQLLLIACSEAPQQNTLVTQPAAKANVIASAEVSNPSRFDRADEHVYFSYYDLGLAAPAQLSANISGTKIPSQNIDLDADGNNDGLLVQVNLAVGESKVIEITDHASGKADSLKRTQAEISRKVGGKWKAHSKQEEFNEYAGGRFENIDTLTPPAHYTDHSYWIRYEGPGIESDKVAYRVYLDWRNGFDIFGKKTAKPILQEIGQDGYDSYHDMQDWGMDILKVGSSLGAGAFAAWNGSELEFVKDTESRTASIKNNGDIFSSFNLAYKKWKRNSNTVDLDAHLSMTAGSRLVNVKLKANDTLGPIGVGFVNHDNTEFIQGDLNIPGDTYTYIGSWGQQSLAGDNLGLAVIFRKRTFSQLSSANNSRSAILNTPGNEFDYYFVAAWQGEHGTDISSKDAFIAYLEKESEKLSIPVRVRLKTRLSEQTKNRSPATENAIKWSTKLADSELMRKTLGYHYDGWDVNRKRPPKFEYDIVGWLPLSYYKLYKETQNPLYAEVLDNVTSSFITDSGDIKRYTFDSYNIDAVAPGSAVLALYLKSGNEKYKKAADLLRKQLKQHPKTSEGAFWHKQKYEWQLWLDGVFMGMPFLAEYSSLFEKHASLEEVIKEYTLTRKYLRDASTGLYYHGWDEKKAQPWANSSTGLSQEFWGRGMGWLAMALVDVLDFIPEHETDMRAPILTMIDEVADALVKVQDQDTGTWWQILDKAGEPGNYRESSATAMFSYFFAKATRLGYLPEHYKAVALRAYNGLINEFVLVHANGDISMTNQCYVAGLGFGRDGSYTYYMQEKVSKNDPKGNFPFILAGIEIHKLTHATP